MVPLAMVGAAGVTPIDTSVAGVMVRVVLPEMPLKAAVRVVTPLLMPFARPLNEAALLMDATVVEDEVQSTAVVRSWMELSV